MGGDSAVPIEILAVNAKFFPDWLTKQLDRVRRFKQPVVIDIGEGSKGILLTIEQLGLDGSALEH